MTFIKLLQKILKQDLTPEIMNLNGIPLRDHCLKDYIGLIKDELGRKIMTIFVGLRAKTYSYLIDEIDDGSEDKKTKAIGKFIIKRKFIFENYINRLEATQLENKINHLQKNKTVIVLRNS